MNNTTSRPNQQTRTQKPATTSAGKKSILLLEPSSFMGRVIKTKLEALGFEVTHVRDLRSLYQSTNTTKPNLIITDIADPITFEQCVKIRNDARMKSIPVVFHSMSPTKKTIVRAVKHADTSTFVIKPASMDTLRKKVYQALGMPEQVIEETVSPLKRKIDEALSTPLKIATLLRHAKELKALPVTVTKALQITQADDSGANDLANTVKSDTAVAEAILRKVNSAHYAGSRKIADLQQAIARIGFEETKKILIGMSVINSFNARNKSINFTRKGFWEHSLATGLLAGSLCKQLRKGNPTVAFTAGLLHDIGKIIFDDIIDHEFEKAVEAAATENKPICETEVDIFGFSHNMLGYAFLRGSKMPDEICQSAYHHNHANFAGLQLDDAISSLVKIIWLSNCLAKALGYAGAGDFTLGMEPSHIADELGLKSSLMPAIIEALDKDMHDFKSFLNFVDEHSDLTPVARDSRTIYYFSPLPNEFDVVELFLKREKFVVMRGNSLADMIGSARELPEKAALLVQLSALHHDLNRVSQELSVLPVEVPVILMGNKAELRLTPNPDQRFETIPWPLSSAQLLARVLNTLQPTLQ